MLLGFNSLHLKPSQAMQPNVAPKPIGAVATAQHVQPESLPNTHCMCTMANLSTSAGSMSSSCSSARSCKLSFRLL